ncbi:hypothetical protein B0H17DRAFT_1328843 [Mycena rosella]|uniref:Uncharacterized protein n=1 Tax=Mycena rosella TaxID=1033263 RepID=A0AAD7DRY4_MYCRO|nr:hypothetical protein B0H17DRAFT_1328843 [Mycena rosella]
MCALSARSFVRPCQIHLFSRVSLRIGLDYHPDSLLPRKLSKLLLSSPHIGAYIRAVTIYCPSGNLECLSHILCSVPNLAKIDVRPQGNAIRAWRFAPAAVRASFLVVCAAPSLRCIVLHDYLFKDARELEALLWNTPNLIELVLSSVHFETDSPPRPPVPSPSRPSEAAFRPILSAFRTVDVTHLRKIKLSGTSARVLRTPLRANARTLEHVVLRLLVVDGMFIGAESISPDILVTLIRLRLLHLRARNVSCAATILGSLALSRFLSSPS